MRKALLLVLSPGRGVQPRGRAGVGDLGRTEGATPLPPGERPAAALRTGPDSVAASLGSFAWESTAAWSTTRGDRKVEVSERHAVRQLATGEFAAEGNDRPGAARARRAGSA